MTVAVQTLAGVAQHRSIRRQVAERGGGIGITRRQHPTQQEFARNNEGAADISSRDISRLQHEVSLQRPEHARLAYIAAGRRLTVGWFRPSSIKLQHGFIL